MNGHLGICRAQCRCPAVALEAESKNLSATREQERRACAELVKSALGQFQPGSREWEWSQLLARAIIERTPTP